MPTQWLQERLHIPKASPGITLEGPFVNSQGGHLESYQVGTAAAVGPYKGTSLIRTPPPVGPNSSPMPKALW